MNQLQEVPHNPAESYDIGWNMEAFDSHHCFDEIVEVYREGGVELCRETAMFGARRLAEHMKEFDAECDRRNAEMEELHREY